MNFQSKKVYDGFSTCFRQWRAKGTHCRFVHGYGVSFEVTFEGELDHRNWVADFGMAKRSIHLFNGMKIDDYFKWLLDHTVIVAEDDPALADFKAMAEKELIQLRVLPQVGCEMFAAHILGVVNKIVHKETEGRVRVSQVQFFEHGKNSAIARA